MTNWPAPDDRETAGQTYRSRGLEKTTGNALIGLTRQAMGYPSEWTFRQPPELTGYTHGTRGTPNHRGQVRTWYCFWAQRAGSEAQKIDSLRQLEIHYEEQFLTQGLMHGEMLTTSHYSHHLLYVCAGRFLAIHHGLQTIIEHTGRFLRQQLWLDQLMDWRGWVLSPGSRPIMNEDTMCHNDLRTVQYCMMMDIPAPPRFEHEGRQMMGNPNNPNGIFWKDVYNSPAWIMRELLLRGDKLGQTATEEHRTEPAKLRDHVGVYKDKSGKVVLVLVPRVTKSGPNFVWWWADIDGEVIESDMTGGSVENMSCPCPWPEFPGATRFVIEGMNGSPSDCPLM